MCCYNAGFPLHLRAAHSMRDGFSPDLPSLQQAATPKGTAFWTTDVNAEDLDIAGKLPTFAHAQGCPLLTHSDLTWATSDVSSVTQRCFPIRRCKQLSAY